MGSLALPRARVKRKRPWSPRTKRALYTFAMDCSVGWIFLVGFVEGGKPFDQFFELLALMYFVVAARRDWTEFQRLRKRDDRGD